MDFIQLSNTRQSCRKYSDKPVSREDILTCLEAARLAPSACNSQPWHVDCSEGTLTVHQQSGFKNPLLRNLGGYMNRIDMGIFFCFLELALEHESVGFGRSLLPDGRVEYTLFSR